MNSEFTQIQEAVELAYELLCGEPVQLDMLPDSLLALEAKLDKIKAARELMVDLAGGNSR